MIYTLEVKGMTCGHCEKAVSNAVLNVDPAASVKIDRALNLAVVQTEAAAEVIVQAIADEGYAVSAA